MHEDDKTAVPEDAAERPIADVASVFVANHRNFLAFLERRLGSRAIAEEILQDAFVRGIGRVASDDEESVVAWFYRTLRNAAIDHHRRHKTASKALEAFAGESPTQEQPDEEMKAAVCACVSHLAQTLKPEYAEALMRVEVEGVPVKDYAVQTGISASNAAVRVFRAREALRKQVKRSCGSCAEHGCLECSCGGAMATGKAGGCG